MKVNQSSTDRSVRAIVGVALLLVALFMVTGVALKIVLIVLAAVALLTAYTGFCPLYRLLKISTKR